MENTVADQFNGHNVSVEITTPIPAHHQPGSLSANSLPYGKGHKLVYRSKHTNNMSRGNSQTSD
jgi:hypothetical protein